MDLWLSIYPNFRRSLSAAGRVGEPPVGRVGRGDSGGTPPQAGPGDAGQRTIRRLHRRPRSKNSPGSTDLKDADCPAAESHSRGKRNCPSVPRAAGAPGAGRPCADDRQIGGCD